MPDTNAPLTDNEYLQLIRDELGAVDSGDAAIVAAYDSLDKNLPLYWRKYQDRRGWGPRVRALYVKRDAVELLLGHMWQAVTNTDSDVSESLSDMFEHLQKLKDSVLGEIALLASVRNAARGPAVGRMEATAPIETPGCLSDPNDRRFRGDPIRRSGYFRR